MSGFLCHNGWEAHFFLERVPISRSRALERAVTDAAEKDGRLAPESAQHGGEAAGGGSAFGRLGLVHDDDVRRDEPAGHLVCHATGHELGRRRVIDAASYKLLHRKTFTLTHSSLRMSSSDTTLSLQQPINDVDRIHAALWHAEVVHAER